MRIEKNWKTYLKFIDVKKKINVKKKIKIQKNLWKVYNSDDFILTSRSLSENTKSQIEEDFQNFEFDSKKQFKKIIRIVKNFENKTNMFMKQFFLKIIEANLNDITNFNYRDVIVKTTSLISKDEIRQIIKKCKFDNVSNSNEISNRILKILIKKLFSSLTSLFRACVEHDYYLRCFREVNIIILKKSNKNNYTNFKTYKLIALLNTIDKTFEFIIARRINTFAEIHKMFFATQMKKRRKRVCETTLKLFTEQIHTILNMSRNKMITLLSMNIASAYDHVSRERLMHNLRKREISD